MKFKALSLALLTAFALNVKAEDAKSTLTQTAPVEQSTPAQAQGVKIDHTLDLPAKDDLGAGAANVPGLTEAQKSAEMANTIDTTQAEAAAKKAKEAADYAKSLIGRTEAFFKSIPTKAQEAYNAVVKTTTECATNFATNGYSMVNNNRIAIAGALLTAGAYYLASNGTFGKKIEKFTNKYKQFVIGATAALSAVLVYKLATTTPEVVAKVVEKAAEAVKATTQAAANATK